MRPLLRPNYSLQRRVDDLVSTKIQQWIDANKDSYLVEFMKDGSSGMIKRLCRNKKLKAAVEAQDHSSIEKILKQAYRNGKRNAYRASQAKRLQTLVSHDLLTEKGFDPDFKTNYTACNDDQELSGMPSDPYEAIEWVLDHELVRSTSRYSPELTEELLALESLPRQVVVLYWCFPKHTTKVKAEILEVNESVMTEITESIVTNTAHRYGRQLQRKLALSVESLR